MSFLLFGFVPEGVEFFKRIVGDRFTLRLCALLHELKASSELVAHHVQGRVGVNVESSGDVDDHEEDITEFFCGVLGVIFL